MVPFLISFPCTPLASPWPDFSGGEIQFLWLRDLDSAILFSLLRLEASIVMTIVMRLLSVPEHYDLANPNEKYDVIPEVWEGHNIADFIDPDIMKVTCLWRLSKKKYYY